MATPIIFKITNAGKNAMLDAQNNGITLRLTHVALGTGKYTPNGNKTALAGELQRWVITSGGIEPATHTVRFSSSITSAQELTAYEIGVFTDTGVLFAVASSTTDPLVKIYPDITFIASFGLSLDDFDVSKITVSQDNEGALSIALMQQHLASPDPHPQYLRKGGVAGSAEDIIERIIALENRKIEPVSVGGLLLTTNNYANSEAVRAGEGYGVWTRYAQGRVIIGQTTSAVVDEVGISRTFNLGQMGGEYSHILTEAEMPSHTHEINQGVVNASGEIGTYTSGDDKTDISDSKITSDTKGGSKPHNNIQPFIVAGVWLRLPDVYVAPTFNTYWTTDVTGMNKVTGFSETDNIYLWIEASGICGNYPISLINVTATRSASTSKLQYFIDANTAEPTSLVNGKNMVYALQAPDSGYFSGNIDLTVDVRYTDVVINKAKRITASTTINDTVQGTNETVFLLGVNQTTGQPKVIKTQGSNGITVTSYDVKSGSGSKYLTAITLRLDSSIDPTDLFINAGWQYSTDDTFIWQSAFSSDPSIQKNSAPDVIAITVTFDADTRNLTIVSKNPVNASYSITGIYPLQIILSSNISVVKNNSDIDRYDNVKNPIQRPFTGLESWAVLRDSQ